MIHLRRSALIPDHSITKNALSKPDSLFATLAVTFEPHIMTNNQQAALGHSITTAQNSSINKNKHRDLCSGSELGGSGEAVVDSGVCTCTHQLVS